MNAADDLIFSGGATVEKDPTKFVMMYHGTLTKIYGLDIAIEALAEAQRDIPNAELWILGDGTERAALEALSQKLGLSGKVRLIGRVKPDQIPQWLQQCDVGVLATRRDVFLEYSFSNKLSEYIIMNKPVISSRLRTIHYYFSDDALAFFEPNNPSSLAKQMVHVHRDATLRERLVTQAKQQYAPIGWQVMKERYLQLAEELCWRTDGAREPGAPKVSGQGVAEVVQHVK
jgi:glycosyltransferase involved in cell wall biosynthesis